MLWEVDVSLTDSDGDHAARQLVAAAAGGACRPHYTATHKTSSSAITKK